VKTFLRGDGHANMYEDLEIKWIRGRTPELFLYSDDGKLIEKIELSTLTTNGIHELLVSKGLQKRTLVG
jgi:hypothetical protein